MTDIDTMPAGPEMDRLVAVKVMGWQKPIADAAHRGNRIGPWYAGGGTWHCDPFSTDIAHAWEVVEKLTVWEHYRSGLDIELWTEGGFWKCYFRRRDKDDKKQSTSVLEDTAPLAICKAALKAVGA